MWEPEDFGKRQEGLHFISWSMVGRQTNTGKCIEPCCVDNIRKKSDFNRAGQDWDLNAAFPQQITLHRQEK